MQSKAIWVIFQIFHLNSMDLVPVVYYHAVFTLPAQSALFVRRAVRVGLGGAAKICSRPKVARGQKRREDGAPYLGPKPDAPPARACHRAGWRLDQGGPLDKDQRRRGQVFVPGEGTVKSVPGHLCEKGVRGARSRPVGAAPGRSAVPGPGGLPRLAQQPVPKALGSVCQAAVRRPQASDRILGALHAQNGYLQPPDLGGDGHQRPLRIQRLPGRRQAQGNDARGRRVPAALLSAHPAQRLPADAALWHPEQCGQSPGCGR